MKIISGKYKGRSLKGINIEGTRPTMDRVKESLFGMIQDYIKDSVVLDLYSGTGNLAIESISNGCKKAYLVDKSRLAINVINDNIKMLNINNAIVINDDASKVLKDFINKNEKIDIIFLDPPYNTNELDKILTILNENTSVLDNNSLIICETELKLDYSKYNNFKIYKERKYGSKLVTILKLNID